MPEWGGKGLIFDNLSSGKGPDPYFDIEKVEISLLSLCVSRDLKGKIKGQTRKVRRLCFFRIIFNIPIITLLYAIIVYRYFEHDEHAIETNNRIAQKQLLSHRRNRVRSLQQGLPCGASQRSHVRSPSSAHIYSTAFS